MNFTKLKKVFFCVGIFFLFSHKLLASKQDSLIYFNDLNFVSAEESASFKLLIGTNEEALVDLLISMNNPDAKTNLKLAKDKIDKCLIKLSNKIDGKDDQAKIKIITSYLEDEFFKIYKARNRFYELFETGTYNNLSFISLHAIIFTKLKIPFQIVKKENALSMIAYPSATKIEINSKENEKKYFVFSDQYIKKFSISLVKNRSISNVETEKSNEIDLFKKYYFGDTIITPQALASLYYSIESLNLFNENKLEEALSEIKKAYYLKSDLSSKFTLKQNLISSLGSNNYKTKSDVDKLVILCRYYNLKDAEVTKDFIIAEHQRLVDVYKEIKQVSVIYAAYHTDVVSNIEDVSTKKELEFNFSYSTLLTLWRNEQYRDTILIFAERIHHLKPEDKNLNTLILDDLSLKIMKLNNTELILLTIEDYGKKFSFVNKSKSIMRVKTNSLLDMACINFNKGLLVEGNNYLEKSTKIRESFSIIPDENYVERAYLEAARNYYISGNHAKAKEYLNKGLELAPQSVKIKERLKMVK
jgi:tetratricopeptide (TPR) repeat protein